MLKQYREGGRRERERFRLKQQRQGPWKQGYSKCGDGKSDTIGKERDRNEANREMKKKPGLFLIQSKVN